MTNTGIDNRTYFEMAPCLKDGPYAENARLLVESSERLGSNRFASTMRAWCVWKLFNLTEEIFANDREPVSNLNKGLASLANFLRSASELEFANGLPLDLEPNGVPAGNGDVKHV